MALFEALHVGRCRSPLGWFRVGESSFFGPELIYKTLEEVHLIRNRFKTTYSRQKSYADQRRRYLAFEEGDKAYLKISSMKGVMRFCKQREVEFLLCGSV